MSQSDASTPATSRIEKFARNFRNMGVVENYEINRDDQTVTVRTNKRGVAFHNILAKGWDMQVLDVALDADGNIRIAIQLDPDEHLDWTDWDP